MKFIHDPAVHEAYPHNFTTLIAVDGFDAERLPSITADMLGSVDDQHLASVVDAVVEQWRAIFRQMGAKPKYKPSVQKLRERFAEAGALWAINPVVDFYNAYSLRAGLPMAAYDRSRIAGDLTLRVVEKGLPFTPLGSPKNPSPTKANEVAYVDEERVVCRYWNMGDCHETRVADSTTSLLFLFDILAEDAGAARRVAERVGADFSTYFDIPATQHLTGPMAGSEVEV